MLAKFFCAHWPYQNKSYENRIFGRHPPVPSSSEGIVLWTDCSSACGNSTAPGGSEGDQASTGSGTSENAPTDDGPEPSDEFPGLFNTNAALPETVLMDESGVKITATGLPYTAYSVDLQLTIENNSGKALTIGNAHGSLSVNGFMTDYLHYSQKLGYALMLEEAN